MCVVVVLFSEGVKGKVLFVKKKEKNNTNMEYVYMPPEKKT